MQSVKRNILLTPGPATTTNEVKLAQVVSDICPRESDFATVIEYVATELTDLVADQTHYATVLFGGSGTAAVESILSSVGSEHTILIINNGAYGKRMCEIAEAYGLHFMEFKSTPENRINLSDLQAIISKSHNKISHLAVVHHETTTGLLNDIASIGQLCRTYGIDLIVDAISSFGAIPIQMSEMNVSYLAASSNKNIQGMPGIAFVVANKQKLESLRQKKPANYYLDLYAQYRYLADTRQMRFTPPVQTFYALKKAIEALKQEGLQKRYERYVKSWQTLTDGIRRLGLTHIVNEDHHAKLVTALIEPDCTKYDFHAMHDFFYTRGFTIYPGKLESLHTFRVANIGDITYKDVEAFLKLLEEYLIFIGFNVDNGITVTKIDRMGAEQ